MVCDSTTGYYPLNSTYEYIVFQDALRFRSLFLKTTGNELWKYSDGASVGLKPKSKSNSNLKVFPNPAYDQLTVELISVPANKSFVLLDLQGKQLMSGRFTGQSTPIDISKIPAGLYFLHSGIGDQKNQIIK